MTDIFRRNKLLPVIIQDVDTNEVLMLAYMNEEAFKRTLETKLVHFFSRSRKKLWLKGETSGNFQQLRSLFVDCDKDALLLKVKQIGGACHNGYKSCFYREFKNGKWRVVQKRVFNPREKYGDKK